MHIWMRVKGKTALVLLLLAFLLNGGLPLFCIIFSILTSPVVLVILGIIFIVIIGAFIAGLADSGEEVKNSQNKIREQSLNKVEEQSQRWLLFNINNKEEVLGTYKNIEDYTETLTKFQKRYNNKLQMFPIVSHVDNKVYIHVDAKTTMMMIKEDDYYNNSTK